MNRDDLAREIYDISSAEDLKAAGARIKNVAGVILRSDEGRIKLLEAGLELKALFTMQELKDSRLLIS